MRSTGEVMGVGRTLPKRSPAQLGSSSMMKKQGARCLRSREGDKERVVDLGRRNC